MFPTVRCAYLGFQHNLLLTMSGWTWSMVNQVRLSELKALCTSGMHIGPQ